MCLSGEVGRGTKSRGGEEARWLRGEADESFTEVQTSRIPIARPVNLAGTFARGSRVRERKDKVGSDLLQGILGVGEAELLAEE